MFMNQEISVKEKSLNPKTAAKETEAINKKSERLDANVIGAVRAAEEKKALEIVVLDLRDIASFTDYFIITSGTNTKQVQAIADEIVDRLKKQGRRASRVEGYSTAEWVLVDYGDFVVHVFEDKARKFFDLERLWREARRVEIQ